MIIEKTGLMDYKKYFMNIIVAFLLYWNYVICVGTFPKPEFILKQHCSRETRLPNTLGSPLHRPGLLEALRALPTPPLPGTFHTYYTPISEGSCPPIPPPAPRAQIATFIKSSWRLLDTWGWVLEVRKNKAKQHAVCMWKWTFLHILSWDNTGYDETSGTSWK